MPAVRESPAPQGAPVQIVFVRLPADAPPQPGEPPTAVGPKKRAPVKRAARRSPARGRKKDQETKKMIKLALAIVLSLACYVILGMYLPFLGYVAVRFPLLAILPVVGAWASFLTFKGIAALSLFGYLGRKLG